MRYKQNVCRGDVFYADLNPVIGSEQGGIRPVLILQNNIGNRFSPTIIVVPLTTKPKKCLPMHHVITKGNYEFLLADSIALVEQIRSIDRSRLKEWIGSLLDKDVERIYTKAIINLASD
ncbi:hypothetical protein CB473P2_00027 [Enterocloster phage CB473P2]|jgi:mRNA interferase MazF|nr:hypothetical protein CB457P2_00027 [Enterocloster phage CB457P2]WAX11314.1 hypothetical protein CB473P1_00027 [Enterocloster phage CB473P1]WAX11447.1 hypothetical protein CB473P2_00027 [Enterocloster phage CB473P2]DAY90472.1 MAG TPA: PemK-like protein [Caudoviricetes sp.]